MKKVFITLLSIFYFTVVFSQDVTVELSEVPVFRETNLLKIKITNNSQYLIFIAGLGHRDDAGNVIDDTPSYYYCNILQNYNTVLESSPKMFFGRTHENWASIRIHPGQSYEIKESFLSKTAIDGFFQPKYGTFLINVVVHLDFLLCDPPQGTAKQMDITSNMITIWNTNSVFERL
jgi:hypothetical protein